MAPRIIEAVLISLLAGSASAGLQWGECPTDAEKSNGLDCATIKVPLDWDRPSGKQITLSMNRIRAKDPGARIGSLIYNAGGPGDAATTEVAAFGDGSFYMSDDLMKHFDIIGLDPRGIGRSSPIQCDYDKYNNPATLFPKTDAEFQQLIKYNKDFALSCLKRSGDLVKYVDTVSVAKDMDAVRAALGDKKINFLGESYGTQIAAAYSELFPHNIRTLVFDGVVDHSLSETTLLATETIAYETEYNRFVAWCGTESSCPLYGQNISQQFDDLINRAEGSGIDAPECKGVCRSPVTAWDILTQFQNLLIYKEVDPKYTYPPTWDFAADALKMAFNGNLTNVATPLAQDDNADGWQGQMVNCLDWNHDISSLADVHYYNQLMKSYAPHTQGTAQSYSNSMQCIGWPFKVRDGNRRTLPKKTPPLLLVNSLYDDQTPYDWAVGLQEQLANSVLLTRDGDGHTSYTLGGESSRLIDAYFINCTLPAENTVVDT